MLQLVSHVLLHLTHFMIVRYLGIIQHISIQNI
jgi:hypothetical protein